VGLYAPLLALLALQPSTYPPARKAIVYEDKYGVPSICASNLKDAAYAIGYVEAKDRAVRMALNYKLARGRLAEVNGKSSLLQDGFLRSVGFEAKAEQKSAQMSGEVKDLVDSFVAGANRGLSEQKGKIPTWIEPFTSVDVLSFMQFVNAAFPLLDLSSKLMPGAGSNQFALAPLRTSTHHPILSMDPHLGWDGQDGGIVWQELAIYTPDINFRGVVIPGLPSGTMGHTDRVAWSMTNNNPLLYTIYNVKTNPENRNQYSYHGNWRDYKTVKQEMRYVENGQLKSNVTTAKLTDWGPMVPFSSHSVRLAVPDPETSLKQSLMMLRARNCREFRDALKMRGVSMWNFVFADIAGNIGYQYNAAVPKRDESLDWTKTVAGEDPKTEWGELWNMDALPHAENPASGMLVNCNSSPNLTPLGNEINGIWPRDVTTYGETTRREILSKLLKTSNRIDPKRAMEFATDCTVPYAKETIQQLARFALAGNAIDILTKWDGKAKVNSVGCVLYTYWMRQRRENDELSRLAGQGTAWTKEQGEEAIASLVFAIQQMTKEQGGLSTSWGNVQYMERGTVKEPVQGFGYVASWSGIAAVSPASAGTATLKNGKSHATFGSSFRMIVSLDPKGIQSWSVLPYGNSDVADSPHYVDQMNLYSLGKYKTTYFGIARAKSYSAKSYTIQY